MRMLFASILLIYTTTAHAVIFRGCANISDDECLSTPGCFLDENLPENNRCSNCLAGFYCPGNDPTEPKKTCSGNFTMSVEGATSIDDCFDTIDDGCTQTDGTPNRNCGWFHPDGNPKCWNPNGEYITGYHREQNDKCYYGTILCSVFGQSGCDAPTGSAYWEDGHWNIGDYCHCEQTNTNYPEKNCIAGMYKVPTQATLYFVQPITYQVLWYYCSGCPAGRYVEHSTDFATNSKCDLLHFPGDDRVVCQCSDVGRGYYSTDFEIDYTQPITDDKYENPPYRSACPAGQTTSGTGATSAEQCQYTSETQFCDSKGCFQFGNDFENWDLHI